MRAETTLKAANVTGQSGQEVSEQLTAVWNGYKVSAQETELYVDKLAAVAATTASDLEELSTGMSKVASAASSMGVDIDQLNGHLSTVISVTRQAPESVGTAFKTIYARLGDLAVGGEDEFGTKLGEVSGKLKQMGIDILDSQGQMRDMGTVMEEVAEKWNGWTDAQRQAAAVAMAGKRQYNNLIALFDNWDMYTEAVSTSANAMGTLQNQQNIYMDSTEAHLDIMRTSFEDLYDSLLSGDDIETFADAITKVVNGLTTFVDSIGGGANTLMLLGSIGTKVFSKQLAQGIGTTISNLQAAKYNATQVQAEFELLEQFKGVPMADKAFKDLIKWKEELLGFGKLVSEEQQNEANSIMKNRNELELEIEAWKEKEQALDSYLKRAGHDTGIDNVKRTPGGGTTSEYDDAHEALEKQKEEINELRPVYEKAESALKDFNAALIENKGKLDSNSAESEELKTQTQNMINAMQEMSEKGLASEDTLDKIAQAMKRFGNTTEITEEEFKELKNTFKSVFNEVEVDNKQAFDNLEKEATEWGNKLEKEISECETRWNNFTKNLKTVQATQQIINLVSGISSLATAIQSLMNIKDIINNEDLSAGEKAIQIITALSTALTIGSLGVSTLGGSFVKLTTILGIYAATEGIAEEATEELTEEIIEQDAVVKTHTVTLGKYTASANTLGGAIKSLLGQQVKLPGALAKVASKFGIASSGAISLGAALGIAAAAIGAVTVGAIALHRWYTKDARAAEEAADAAQKASEAANSVKEVHQGVIDTLNQYDTATEKMNSLTKGTQEWKDALNEANASVLDLLNTFPGLASGEGYIKRINGQLQLTEEGLDYVREKSESMLTSTTAAANIANVESQKAQTKSDITDFSRDVTYTTTRTRYSGKQGSKETEVSQRNQGIDRDIVQATVDALREDSSFLGQKSSDIKAAFSEEGIQVGEDIIKALQENSGELLTLANTIEAAETSEDFVYEQIAASALQDNDQYQGLSGEAQGAVNQIVGDELQDEVEKLANSTFATMTDANEEAAKQFYGAQMTREGEEEGTTDYLINGAWHTFADDVTLMSLATEEATKGVENLAESTLKTAKQIDALGVSDALKGALFGFTEGKVGDLSSLDSGEIQELKDYNTNNSDLLSKLGITELGKALESEVQNRLDVILGNADNQELIEKHSSDNFDITKLLKSEDLSNAILDMTAAGLDLESVFDQIDWSTMDSENAESWFKNAFEKGIEKAQETAWGSEEKINLSRNSLGVLSKGDESELSEEELAHLQELEAEYEELGAIQDRTSHAYLETLRQIKEEQEKIALENELTNFNNTAQEIENLSLEIEQMKESGADPIDIQVKTEELDALLDEIEESDYRIKVLVEADLASDVEDAFGLAEEFSNLQEMIPQSLEVTYAEAQAIIESGNGAILQNSVETANQTIMLHGETANAYIDAKQAELEASKQQKIQELEQERALLVAQREALTGKLEALQTALTAQDAASAAAALQEAQRYDELYKAKVEELNAKLTAEGEKATEEGNINEELYNNLGGMYETDVTNQENA